MPNIMASMDCKKDDLLTLTGSVQIRIDKYLTNYAHLQWSTTPHMRRGCCRLSRSRRKLP